MSKALPRGWIEAKLKDVAVWSSGGTPSRSNPSFYSGTIPWIKTGELGPRFITDSEEKITEDAIASSSAKVFPKGAVVLAMYGATIGKASILGIDAATNQACAVGIPDAVGADFLYYYLLSQKEAFIDAGKGGAQPNISQRIVKDWPILVPPYKEQNRIVEKLEQLLDSHDEGITELKSAQEKLARYRLSFLKATLNGELTSDWRAQRSELGKTNENGAQLLARILIERRSRWEAKQLAKYKEQQKLPPKGWENKYPQPVSPDTNNLPILPDGWAWASVEQLGNVQLGRQRSPDKTRGRYPAKYIRAANITEQGISFDDVLEMDFSETEREIFSLKAGDVLLTEASGSPEHVGRPAIWPEIDEMFCFQNTVLRFTPQGISSEFAFYLFYALQKLGEFMKVAGGVGINHLSAGKFSKLAVPLPPLEEQQTLVERLKKLLSTTVEQEKFIEHSLKQSTAQRKNILKTAFLGNFVPQDPNDEPASNLLERIRSEREAREKVKRAPEMKKPRPMAKVDTEMIRKWIENYSNPQFSFAEIRKSFPYDYGTLKDLIFQLLDEKHSVIQQTFNEKSGNLEFKKVKP